MKTKAELQQAHGTPEQFFRAIQRALNQGYIKLDEAQQATDSYAAEYAAAPGDSSIPITAAEVDGWFNEGRLRAFDDVVEQVATICPYPEDQISSLWWKRGYEYAVMEGLKKVMGQLPGPKPKA